VLFLTDLHRVTVGMCTLNLQIQVFWVVTPCSVVLGCHAASIFTLKMEATWTSETSVSYHNITLRRKSENLDLNLHHREHPKSRMGIFISNVSNILFAVLCHWS
jgi:hypothetical protein